MNQLLEPSALPLVSRSIAHCSTIIVSTVAVDGNDEPTAKLSTTDAADDAEHATYTAKDRTNV